MTEEREAETETPAEREDRVESRDAFADISDAEAIDLARGEFPEVLTGPIQASERLKNGARVAEYTSQYVAQVESATGNSLGILETDVPLTVDEKANTPVDLSLRAEGGSYVPAQPLVAVDLPAEASEAATLSDAGVSFKPVGADDSAAQEVGDRLLFASIDTDTDYILQPTERGVESFWQLRSVDSPQQLRQRVIVPDGAQLTERPGPGPDASPTITVDRGDETLAVVQPVSARVDDDEIVIDLDHRDQKITYPILVDPEYAAAETWDQGQLTDNCGADPNVKDRGWVTEVQGSTPASYWWSNCAYGNTNYGAKTTADSGSRPTKARSSRPGQAWRRTTAPATTPTSPTSPGTAGAIAGTTTPSATSASTPRAPSPGAARASTTPPTTTPPRPSTGPPTATETSTARPSGSASPAPSSALETSPAPPAPASRSATAGHRRVQRSSVAPPPSPTTARTRSASHGRAHHP